MLFAIDSKTVLNSVAQYESKVKNAIYNTEGCYC